MHFHHHSTRIQSNENSSEQYGVTISQGGCGMVVIQIFCGLDLFDKHWIEL